MQPDSVAMVVERPARNAENVTYIPNLEEGVVELTPGAQEKLLQEVNCLCSIKRLDINQFGQLCGKL